jgi:hypothetical protein
MSRLSVIAAIAFSSLMNSGCTLLLVSALADSNSESKAKQGETSAQSSGANTSEQSGARLRPA